MRHNIFIGVFLLFIVSVTLTFAATYYVTPMASAPCPEASEGMPCFTLSQYATKSNYYYHYFAPNSTFILLSGNHNLDSELGIRSIDFLSITFTQSDSVRDTSITCSQSARFSLTDIGVVSMRGLVLIGCMNNTIASIEQFTLEDCSLQGQGRNGTGLKLNLVVNASILRSSFSANTGIEYLDTSFYYTLYVRRGGAITVSESTVTISSCTFTNNTASGGDGAGHGGAMAADVSNVSIYNSTFNKNVIRSFGYAYGGAVYVYQSNITIDSSTFANNRATGLNGYDGNGGAMAADSSFVSIRNSTFTKNTATGNSPMGAGLGGAVRFAAYSSCNVMIQNSTFIDNTAIGAEGSGGAVYAASCELTTIHSSTFTNNTAAGNSSQQSEGDGGAVWALLSDIVINSSNFANNTAKGYNGDGGAVSASLSNLIVLRSTFIKNAATGSFGVGGAVKTYLSNSTIHSSAFTNNTAKGIYAGTGGAINCEACFFSIHNTTFANNNVTGEFGMGGAVYVDRSSVSMKNSNYTHNTATGNHHAIGQGGAVSAAESNITMNNSSFTKNIVNGAGGAIYLSENATLTSSGFLDIQHNVAVIGGALYALQITMNFLGKSTISHNCGSLYFISCNVTFVGCTNIMNNRYSNTTQEGGALTAIQSEIVFTGTASLRYNTAIHGGAISVTQSKLYVYGDISIVHNIASLSGGGIYAYQSELNLENYINIINNSAVERGGGIHVISSITKMTDRSKTYFIGNLAERGGGACLEQNAKLYTIKKKFECYNKCEESDPTLFNNDNETWIRLQFTENFANYGGALYITDDTNSGTCHATPFSGESTISGECFIQGLFLNANNDVSMMNIRNINFINNWATETGHQIYGGLLDRCTVNPYAEILRKLNESRSDYSLAFTQSSLSAVSYILNITNFGTEDFNNSTTMISSDPVRVCFCRDNQPDCSYHPQPVYVRKGETFTVSLVAVDQVNNTKANSIIHAYVPLPSSLSEEQSAQKTSENRTCSELKYTILSSHKSEVLNLYAEGPCMNIGISTANLIVYIEECPVGFSDLDTNMRCECDTSLKDVYIYNCSIDNQTVLRKGNVWFSYVNTTDHPHSYILHKHCPFDYCRPPTESVHVNLTITNGADVMCAYNRTSKLCGSCKNGLSLSLGSSRCTPCSNNWLALLIVFAMAGVALVAFLLLCNLTVAVGTINGLIFYANIISANRAVFLPFHKPNILTIFIAWLNLDFGFETCFYNGMDGYAKTWLQLAFPLYIISLVAAIVVISDYSFRFAAIFRGKDPIATLATLVLLSYTKLIRTIIASLSFTRLEYSDGSHEMVWLLDANVPYLKGKHVPLFIAALFVVIVAMAYTLLLLGWQWINRCCPNIWITKNTKLNSFFDTYHNPYNKDHRYWIGLLLLVRALLYLVSAVNVLGDPRINLLSINTGVGFLFLLQVAVLQKQQIHKRTLCHALENVSLANLIGFTSITFYITEDSKNQAVVAYISTAIAFITFLAIILYHTCMFVLMRPFQRVKSLCTAHQSRFQPLLIPEIAANNTSSLEEEMVSVTYIDLPEPVDTIDDDQPQESATTDYYAEFEPTNTEGHPRPVKDTKTCSNAKATSKSAAIEINSLNSAPKNEPTATGLSDHDLQSFVAHENSDCDEIISGDESTPLLAQD